MMLADVPVPTICPNTITVNGTSICSPLEGISSLGDVVNKLTTFIMPIAAVILFFVLIWGGYDFILARGSAEKVKSAQAKITAGVIGFILLISSYAIVKIIITIFGLGNGIL